MKTRTFAISLLVILLTLLAAGARAEDYTYTTNANKITITDYTGPGGDVMIPDTITGLVVNRIANQAFYYATSVTSITIPRSITTIGESAFNYCTSLAVIIVDPLNSAYTSVDGVLFNKSQTILIQYPGGKADSSYIIPNTVSSFGYGAFSHCAGLTSVTIPASVTSIGSLAFAYCPNLSDAELPTSVTSIGQYAFSDCTSLTAVAVPESVTFIGNGAFQRCTSLINIEIPNSVTMISGSAFAGCTSLASVTIPTSVTMIASGLFYDCTSLTNVWVPNTVTNIGGYAFDNCTSLYHITIPSSVASIGDRAFESCTSLTEILFQGNAPSIGLNVFANVWQATVFYLPGTSGWGATFGGLPTKLLLPPLPLAISPCYPIAETAQAEIALSSAFDGTNFLIGIRGNTSSPNTVGAQLISPSGDLVGGFISTGRNTEGQIAAPYLAFGTNNYLMTWTDAASQHASSGTDVYAQFVSPAGALVGDAFPVSSASEDQDANGVAYDGTNFFVVWTHQGALRGRLISPAGQLLGSELAITSTQVEGEGLVSVAYGGGQYLVAWVEGTSQSWLTKGRLISPTGQLGDILMLSQTTSDGYNPTSVAYGGDRFMVVWHHNASGSSDWNLWGRMVLPGGSMAGDEFIVANGPNDERAMGGSVAFDGQYFLVVWTDWVGEFLSGEATVLGRYWNSDGVPQGSVFTVEGTPAKQLAVGLSSGSGKVLTVVNTDFFSSAADLCARFITRPFTQLTPTGTGSIQMSFGGVLQSSTNLQIWTDVTPQPTSPWITPIGESNLFFRAWAGTEP